MTLNSQETLDGIFSCIESQFKELSVRRVRETTSKYQTLRRLHLMWVDCYNSKCDAKHIVVPDYESQGVMHDIPVSRAIFARKATSPWSDESEEETFIHRISRSPPCTTDLYETNHELRTSPLGDGGNLYGTSEPRVEEAPDWVDTIHDEGDPLGLLHREEGLLWESFNSVQSMDTD